jgi:hypothetical protein
VIKTPYLSLKCVAERLISKGSSAMGDSTIIAAVITAIAVIFAALITVGAIKFDTVNEPVDRPSDVYVYEEPSPTPYIYTNLDNP